MGLWIVGGDGVAALKEGLNLASTASGVWRMQPVVSLTALRPGDLPCWVRYSTDHSLKRTDF
jgi:hypothetical protein